jgi:hypothetical protein
MARKLIEMHQQYLIVCDNPACDHKIENPTGDPNEDISMFVNSPCPLCGKNLLTEKDYKDSLKVLRVINWLNKWFSWVMYLVPKSHKMAKSYLQFNKKDQ